MDAGQQEILDIFTRTRALLQGHFVLRSGLHSGHYFQCAQVCQRMDAVERLAELLLAKVRAQGLVFSTVLAPAMGGLVIGQELARQAKARYIFAEKENNVLVLRRGFTLAAGEPVLVVEDVVTRGGRVLESLEIVRQAGGTAVGRRDAGGPQRRGRTLCRAGGVAAGTQFSHLSGRRRAGVAGENPDREAGQLSTRLPSAHVGTRPSPAQRPDGGTVMTAKRIWPR